MGIRNISTLLVLCWTMVAMAQAPRIECTVDRNTLPAGETFKLVISVENTRAKIQNPSMEGLRIVRGPFESSNFSYVNGKMTSAISRTFMIQAIEEGKFKIGAASIVVNGKTYSSKPITISVVKGAPINSSDKGAAVPKGQDRDIFTSVSLSKRKAYVGEMVTATYTLYSRFPSVNFNKQELPKLNGFFTEEIDLGAANWEPNRKTINGIPYHYAILKKQVLFPQRPGELIIEPMKIECTVSSGGFFSRSVSKTLYSNREKIAVQELPQGPSDFNGAVGDLNMTAILDRQEVPTNEAVNLKVTFNGRCNLKLIPTPKLDLPTDFEVYEPKIEDRIRVNGSGMSGSRTINYLIIPRYPGEYDLQDINVSFFDPASKQYRSLRSADLRLTVTAGSDDESGVVRIPEKRDVEALDSDIRYIRTGDLQLEDKNDFLFASVPYMAGMALPGLLFVGLVFWKRKKEEQNADVAGTRKRKADRVVKKRLAQAEAAIKNDTEQFMEELHKAITGYVGDKFNLAPGQIDRNTIIGRSVQAGVNEQDHTALVELLSELEMARYAPVSDAPHAALLERAKTIISNYEDSI